MEIKNEKNKALFLDRDGIINVDKSYVFRFEDVEWMPGIVELIAFANRNHFKVIVLTNQSGIDRGYYKEQDVLALHAQMEKELLRLGAIVDGWFYCGLLDSPDRKPNPGMMLSARDEFNIDLSQSFMVGDKKSDILNCEGPTYILINGNYELENLPPYVHLFQDLFEVREFLEKQYR